MKSYKFWKKGRCFIWLDIRLGFGLGFNVDPEELEIVLGPVYFSIDWSNKNFLTLLK